MSVPHAAWNHSSPSGRIIVKFFTVGVFENLLTKSKFHEKLKRITVTLREDPCAFVIMPR